MQDVVTGYERHITTGLVWCSTLEECQEFVGAPLGPKAQKAGTLRPPIYGRWCMPHNGGYMVELTLDHECINKGNGKLDFEKFVRSTLGCYRVYADKRRRISDARKCEYHSVMFLPNASRIVAAAYEPQRRRAWVARKGITQRIEVQMSTAPAPQHIVIQRTKTETETLWIPTGSSVDLTIAG